MAPERVVYNQGGLRVSEAGHGLVIVDVTRGGREYRFLTLVDAPTVIKVLRPRAGKART